MQPEGTGWRTCAQEARKCRECLARKRDGSVPWIAALISSQPGAQAGRRPLRGREVLRTTHLEIGEHRCEIVVADLRKSCHDVFLLICCPFQWSDLTAPK